MGLPSRDELSEWLAAMVAFGSRLNGSAGHRAFVDDLDVRFRAIGLSTERIAHRAAFRWTAGPATLSAEGLGPLPVLSTFAHCAAGEVTAPLHDGGLAGRDLVFGPEVRGRILLLEATPPTQQLADWFPDLIGRSPELSEMPATQDRLLLVMRHVAFPMIERAAAAGAVGLIVAWRGVSDAAGANQYLPLSHPLGPLPAVWVGAATGQALRAHAAAGGAVSLSVEAPVEADALSETLVATLPGTGPEAIVLWSHSDGVNAVQENGALGILAIARAHAALPLADRPRSLVCVLSDGHLAEHYVRSDLWLDDRPDLVERAMCAICLEHLGAQEWADDPSTGAFGPTGRTELALTFATDRTLGEAFVESLKAGGAGRVAVIAVSPQAFAPGLTIAGAGVPTLAYLPMPQHLLQQTPDGGLDRVDPDRLYAETRIFTDLVARLQALPALPRHTDLSTLPPFARRQGHGR